MSARSVPRVRFAIASVAAAALVLLSTRTVTPQSAGRGPEIAPQLRERTDRGDRVRVLVELSVPAHVPEGNLPNNTARLIQRQRLNDVQSRVLSRVPAGNARVIHRYATLPYVALEVNSAALDALQNADVVRVLDDRIVKPVLAESVPQIQGDQVWAAGYDGSGKSIAVLDTGVEATHPFLAGKVIAEACFSSNQVLVSQSFCPNGQSSQIGPGSATPCTLDGCFHGTHVAGIAAGSGLPAGQPFSGVAKGANIVAVQVFSEVSEFACGGAGPCLGGFTSDIIAGLEWVYTVAPTYHIAAVNMSLGEGQFFANCDAEPYKPAIDALRSIGVASVVAAGNDGNTDSTMTPACVSTAVSVGAVDKADHVAWFSNVASFLSLFAPGDEIVSSVTGHEFEAVSGTSIAAPHIAGAWALLKQALPNASVTTILNALRATGKPIVDNREGGTITIPRAAVFEALSSLTPINNPTPTIAVLSPAHARATGPAFTLTITGSGFNAFSVAQWNGANRPTHIVNATTIELSIPASDLQLTAAGTAAISVVNPAPGGGTSSTVTFVIDAPPAIAVNTTTAAPGGSVTMTLTNGFAGQYDWLSLAAVGAPYSSNVNWTYIGSGLETKTWTVNMPQTEGQYEFRLFLDNVYQFSTKSAPITVAIPPNPAPVVTALSPSRAAVGGSSFSLTVNGSDFRNSSVVRWNGTVRPTTYSSTSQLQALISASDIAALGTASVSVFTPTPGGGTSGSLTFTIDPPPTLTVNSTSAGAGSPATVTLTNGLGGSTDWLGLYATGTGDTSYLSWTYVGTGVTTRTWTTNLPAATGTYEFRLYRNGYSRVATSPTVTVVPGGPAISTLSPSSAGLGGPAFTLTVNGSGFLSSSIVRWNGADRTTTYVSAAQLTAAIPAGDIAASGTAQVSVFTPPPGGGASASVSFSISQQPSLSVSTTNIVGGNPITVTLNSSPGGSQDWLAFAATSASNNSYVQWIYVGAGVTTRTWTVSAPTAPGTYEFRLFLNNSYTRAATSPAITVTAPPPPSLTVSATSVTGGAQVTVTLANGVGGGTDWLALAPSNGANTSYSQWVYVGSGITSRTWTVAMPTTPGTYEFRLFLNNAYTRAATSPPVTVTP